VGAAIGVLAPSQDIAGVTCNLLTVVITFLSPVFVPISKLPGVLQISARLLPPSYASDALRQTLGGHLTGSVILDVSVLAAFSVAGIYLATARLDWRSR
jgi:ABC-type multidrug transport system permease subunit